MTGPVILVTGGGGFVGSHTVLELLNDGHAIVVVDNEVNCVPGETKPVSLERVEKLTGKPVIFHRADITDKQGLREIFSKYDVTTVIHFAGLKAVSESTRLPLQYYWNNVAGTVTLLEVLMERNVKSFIFSSSSTVYGTPQNLPINEQHPTGQGITNPYGMSKHMIEQILRDLCKAQPEMSVVLLRYFNPVGAHESGQIGEDPNGTPNNLMPFVAQVAVGVQPKLNVYGDDYDTPDGTGVRDYIHVVDLARGHLAALKRTSTPGCHVYNLGTGKGYSVLQLVEAFRAASGAAVPYQVVGRRAGDVAMAYADCSLAKKELGWQAHLTLQDMCADSWRWQSNNRLGFKTEKTPEKNGHAS